MSNERIDTILRRIRERNTFAGISRYKYKVDIQAELELINEIGKMRTPEFVIDNHNRFAYENILKWIIGDDSALALNPDTKQPIKANFKAGLYIAGNTGSGKSWCLDIFAEYASVNKFKLSIGESDGQLNWSNFRADIIADRFQETGQIEFKTTHQIGIQDLGCEPRESVYMGNRVNVMQNLLEYRGDHETALTFITSNIPMSHRLMVDRYGERVQSRLRQMCNYYEINGIDRRKL